MINNPDIPEYYYNANFNYFVQKIIANNPNLQGNIYVMRLR